MSYLYDGQGKDLEILLIIFSSVLFKPIYLVNQDIFKSCDDLLEIVLKEQKIDRHYELQSWEVEKMISIMEQVASGNYSANVTEFTNSGYSETIRRIAEAFGMMMVEIEARECYLEKLNEELNRLNIDMKKNIIQTVITIAHSLGARDRYSEGHAQRVSQYAQRLAVGIRLSAEEVENIRIGGLLHDIGKIGFSDDVFRNDSGHPSEAILSEIRKHPMIGKAILKDLDFLSPIINDVCCHHEREDGSGYPRGLTGDKIPLGAKIIGIADTFDALTTDRPYQKARSPEEAFSILEKISGEGFNPELVETFIAEIRKNGM
jgi:HD-GYP domain-containing protein (c-di-GMP phosphodiesterase class II)